MFARPIFASKPKAIIAFIIIVIIFNISLKSIFFGADREILYDYGMDYLVCFKADPRCLYRSYVKLANTGSVELNNVSIRFKQFPKDANIRLRVKNLNASKPRGENPIFENRYLQEGNFLRISNFTPGALVIMEFEGYIPIESRHVLENLGIEIIANAPVIHSNPEATEFMRILRIFF